MAQNAQTAPIDPVALPGSGGGSSDVVIVTIDGVQYPYNKATEKLGPPITNGSIGPPAPKQGTKQLHQAPDGSWGLVDETTGVWTPVTGMPAGTPKAATPELRQGPDGNWYTVSPDGKTATRVEGMGSAPEDTAAKTNAETAKETLQFNKDQAAAKAIQDQLQQQIDSGVISNNQAIAMFDRQLAMMTFGETAGQDAMNAARLQTENQVGPHFGADFAAGLRASATGDVSQLPQWDASDVTTPTPNYQAIAEAATARAIAHLSPYAAALASGQGSTGDGGSQTAADQTTQTTAGIPPSGSMIPNYKGPPGPANGWLPDAPGRQFTAPHPPFVGVGAYRPGG